MLYHLFRTEGSLVYGYHLDSSRGLTTAEFEWIRWLVAETYEPHLTVTAPPQGDFVVIGPRLSIETPESSNHINACRFMGIDCITRFERTRWLRLPHGMRESELLAREMDRMTEQHYPALLQSFDTGAVPAAVQSVDLSEGLHILREAAKTYGLSMDDEDIAYYHHLFTNVWKRATNDVELAQLSNMNSEHCRHWQFKGKQKIDGQIMPHTLLELIQEPLKRLTDDHVTLKAFDDNAGVSHGFETIMLLPRLPGRPSLMQLLPKSVHVTATAETHNHPTGVSPFHGAATGPGGEIRDGKAVGRGAEVGIGAPGYIVGNLFIPDYPIPGEVAGEGVRSKYAQPLEILIEGSNGASTYNNQIGRPGTLGICRTWGQIVGAEWYEYRKPVLYTAGIGRIYEENLAKAKPEAGMLLVRIGGPAYPVGMSGASASSTSSGESGEAVDYDSVQRGNPAEENAANRVIRACAQLGPDNPIASIHDQGAGGVSNVFTELMEPAGGQVDIRKVTVGDKSMSVRQIWTAEFQESYGLLVSPERLAALQAICTREQVPCDVLGKITGDGYVVVEDPITGTTPVRLSLHDVLTHVPQKMFESTRRTRDLKPINLPDISLSEALQAVFKLPSVGSKGFLVHKLDRSVTGLVAQQQCCGIAQIPIADVSINALSLFDVRGSAAALGERPQLSLIDPGASSRMATGEAITNMAGAQITRFGDIRWRANWMLASKVKHQRADLYDATKSVSDFLIELGQAASGGKDSLSMSMTIGSETAVAPLTLVMLGYAPVPDVRKKVTPEVKHPGESNLYLIDLGMGKNRLGGSALAQAFNQLGNESPDIDAALLIRAFNVVQQMAKEGVVAAVHDRSDGGLITAVAEMCMASRCGFDLYVPSNAQALSELFAEELGFVLEVKQKNITRVSEICHALEAPLLYIGAARSDRRCTVYAGLSESKCLLEADITNIRCWWEATSTALEKQQMNAGCAEEEARTHGRSYPLPTDPPDYHLTFRPKRSPKSLIGDSDDPRVAVIREKGTNGDQEMLGACMEAGFSATEVAMSDIASGRVSLERFQALIAPGGFSYADVLGSAKCWGGEILCNTRLLDEFEKFYRRRDTLTLGVCNGCQLWTLIGWVPFKELPIEMRPRFVHNLSGEGIRGGKFESRLARVEVRSSPSVWFAGMTGSKLPVWIAHGEGRYLCPDSGVAERIEAEKLVCLRYLDPFGSVTEEYPFNPNGSPGGIAALCTPDGRHMAMMPHPERCFRLWQWPWMPQPWSGLEASPWLRMFQNAHDWCLEHH